MKRFYFVGVSLRTFSRFSSCSKFLFNVSKLIDWHEWIISICSITMLYATIGKANRLPAEYSNAVRIDEIYWFKLRDRLNDKIRLMLWRSFLFNVTHFPLSSFLFTLRFFCSAVYFLLSSPLQSFSFERVTKINTERSNFESGRGEKTSLPFLIRIIYLRIQFCLVLKFNI